MGPGTKEARLEPRLVGDISGKFFIPAYQRGYRWGEHEVGKLLDDIWQSLGKPYYLQPVVVKSHGDEWELVDGQQRLTTLFLIFQYMQTHGLQSAGASYELRYETRASSAAYLRAPVVERSQENIDFFHIHQAYECIREWFSKHGHREQFVANEFYGALFRDVRVIWYEAPEEVDATTLFTRLNVGRIPLTDAELVKAQLLSESRDEITATNRAHEIAAQWDSFERDLRDPELWAFITGSATPEPTHISLLFDTLAGGPVGRDRPPFYTFETLREQIDERPLDFWTRVVQLHASVLGWYSNRDLFHKIGFLINLRAATFGGLLAVAEDKTKSEFNDLLDGLIRGQLNLSESGLRELSYSSGKTSGALLLMNVETIRRRVHSTERYSFKEHATGRWSLEHIHAQSAEGIRNTESNWGTWLRLQRDALSGVDAVDSATKHDLINRTNTLLGADKMTRGDFQDLEREYNALFSTDEGATEDAMHSISNLALLHGGDNSALSNSTFAAKREEILRRDRAGSYIPVCTRDVFLKYYSPAGEHQMHLWSNKDREHYLRALLSTLSPYLLSEEAQS